MVDRESLINAWSRNSIAPALQLLGQRGSATGYAIRDFLYRSGVRFIWVELTGDEQAQKLAGVAGLWDIRLPVCLFPEGTRLECPTIRQIAEKLGWYKNLNCREDDLAILGGGPAGLSAAVYGGSEGLRTVLIERSVLGGPTRRPGMSVHHMETNARPATKNRLGPHGSGDSPETIFIRRLF
jgi:hypothetical protein